MSANRWRRWHKVLGIVLGVPLLLIALSGSILLFKENLIAMSLPGGLSYGAAAGESYSVEGLATGLQQILQHHELDDVFYIKTPTQGRQYWWLSTRDGDVHLYRGDNAAAIEDRWNVVPALQWLTEFHTEVLLHGAGSVLVTLLGLGILVLMLAGLCSWLPGRRGFRIRHLWILPTRRGPALRQHRAIAIVCLPLLVLSVVTGAGMSVQAALHFLFESTDSQAAPVAAEPAAFVFELSQLDKLLRSAQQQLPQSEITMLALPGSGKPYIRLRFRGETEWHVNGKSNVLIDTGSGELSVDHVTQSSTGRRLLNTFYPLHASYGLPAYYKTLVAITGGLTVILGLSGLFAWLRRRGGALA